MKSLRLILGLVAIAGLAACSRDGMNKLAGDAPASPAPTDNAAVPDQVLMEKLAAEIAAEATESLAPSLSAACPSTGTVVFSSYPVTITPVTQASSRTYTVNGVRYFSAVQYNRTGAILLYIDERINGCLVDRKIFGEYSVKGTSFLNWTPAGGETQYQLYSYEYTYNYYGDSLVISGYYEINRNGSVTRYPVNRTIPV